MFRLKLRIMEKATRRTWVAFYPWDNGIALCIATGSIRLIDCGRAGYSEFNDRDEAILDSWIKQDWLVRIVENAS